MMKFKLQCIGFMHHNINLMITRNLNLKGGLYIKNTEFLYHERKIYKWAIYDFEFLFIWNFNPNCNLKSFLTGKIFNLTTENYSVTPCYN